MGTELFAGLGRAFEGFRKGAESPPTISTPRPRPFLGGVWDGWVLNAQAAAEARLRGQRGRGVRLEGHLRRSRLLSLLATPGRAIAYSLFRASATGGWSVETPFQLTLGGRGILRGYREEDYPGARRIVMTLEDRIYLPSPAPGLFDVGLAFFVDVGPHGGRGRTLRTGFGVARHGGGRAPSRAPPRHQQRDPHRPGFPHRRNGPNSKT